MSNIFRPFAVHELGRLGLILILCGLLALPAGCSGASRPLPATPTTAAATPASGDATAASGDATPASGDATAASPAAAPAGTAEAAAPPQSDGAPALWPTPAGRPPAKRPLTGPIRPDPNFVSTLVRAPVAWRRSTGAGATVAVIRNHAERLDLVNIVAPDARVVSFPADQQLKTRATPVVTLLRAQKIRLLVILRPEDFQPSALREAVSDLTAADIAVFVNATGRPGEAMTSLVRDLESAGAITVGHLDASGIASGTDTALRPVNVFAPYGRAVGAAPDGAALTAAGAAALLLAVEPHAPAAFIKKRLVDNAAAMYQATDLATGRWEPSRVIVDPASGDHAIGPGAFFFKRVDAAALLDQRILEQGQEAPWPVNALNAPAAWSTATGLGVKIAVLDQGFHVDNRVLHDHLVDQAAFSSGKDFSGAQNFHGTAMAKIVLAVAPEASLIFLLADERGDSGTVAAQVEAIDYAIAQDVAVITCSSGPGANTPQFHAAIDRAIQAGIVVVWSQYSGPNPAVIRPGPFTQSGWDVGAFDRFFEAGRPAELEGDPSAAAPQIAGIAALIRQNEPDLSPLEVKRRIIETAAILPGPPGASAAGSLADADAAVHNRPSGRKLPDAPTPGLPVVDLDESGY